MGKHRQRRGRDVCAQDREGDAYKAEDREGDAYKAQDREGDAYKADFHRVWRNWEQSSSFVGSWRETSNP